MGQVNFVRYGNMTARMDSDYSVHFYCDVTNRFVCDSTGELVRMNDSLVVAHSLSGRFLLEVQTAMDVIKALRDSWKDNPKSTARERALANKQFAEWAGYEDDDLDDWT